MGSVFLLAVPVMALLLVLGPLLLPEFRDPDAGRLDLPSAALSLVSVLAMIYGLKQIAQDGFGWTAVGVLLAGVGLGGLFVRRQRRLADPLIDLRLFRIPTFSVSLVAFTLSLFAAFGVFFLLSQYLQLVLELSPLRAGLWSLPAAGGLVVGSLLAPALVRIARPAYVMTVGMMVAAVGFASLVMTDGLAVLVAGSTVFSLGVAPVGTLATDLIVGCVPPERAGVASGISETGAEFGGALGIAVLGSIGAAVYRHSLPGTVAAGDTLGGATAAAYELPQELRDAVLGPARAAFVDGFDVVVLVAAALSALVGILTLTLLRKELPDD